ncbi:hypothetical protein ACQ4PT_022299 [Festuca glaucescens]
MQGEDPKEQQLKGPRLRSGKDKLPRLERGRLQRQRRRRQEKNRVNQMILSPFLVWVPEQTVRLSKGLQRRILRLIPRLVEGQQLLLQQHLCGRHHPQQILRTTYLRYLEELPCHLMNFKRLKERVKREDVLGWSGINGPVNERQKLLLRRMNGI